jgi:cell fate (sporulation/competence/biofilm development) regulator YlbF (YheA/YmcA/DUF963 family)
MNTDAIINEAKQLGTFIAANKIAMDYKSASAAYRNDPELQNLIFEYNAQSAVLGKERGEGGNPETAEVVSKRVDELLKSITSHKVYTEFTRAQDAMNELINQVNEAISSSIFGQSSCSGSCNGCSGSCCS